MRTRSRGYAAASSGYSARMQSSWIAYVALNFLDSKQKNNMLFSALFSLVGPAIVSLLSRSRFDFDFNTCWLLSMKPDSSVAYNHHAATTRTFWQFRILPGEESAEKPEFPHFCVLHFLSINESSCFVRMVVGCFVISAGPLRADAAQHPKP